MPDKATPKPRQTPATWRVDGISREAVARAEQAAARAGAPLGVWLRRVIRETAAREREEGRTRRAAPRQA